MSGWIDLAMVKINANFSTAVAKAKSTERRNFVDLYLRCHAQDIVHDENTAPTQVTHSDLAASRFQSGSPFAGVPKISNDPRFSGRLSHLGGLSNIGCPSHPGALSNSGGFSHPGVFYQPR